MANWIKKWTVPSSSDPKKTYTVSQADDGTFGCSCPAWTRMRRECKHIKEVKARMLGEGMDVKDLSGDDIDHLFGDKPRGIGEKPKVKEKSFLERLAEEAPWRFA